MKIQTHSFKIVLLTLLITVSASMACAINLNNSNGGEDISLQQTLVALKLTQTALENQIPPTEIPPTESAPTEEQPATPDIIYEGVSFSFDRSIARGIFTATIPEQNLGDDYMPGMNFPTHFEFTFESYAVNDPFHTPIIRVYPVDEYRAISPYVSDSIDDLVRVLDNQAPIGMMSGMPFLPIFPAAQFFAAQVEYFDFQNGRGVRYLTMYGQGLSPVDNRNLFYTYQGITNDGSYYVSAILPVSHTALPDNGDDEVDDWEALAENWETYISEITQWLDLQEHASFTPNLSMLDLMMASFQINR